ncbi:MAG TPA: Dabb family protein [Eubacteriales bacterium]|nr:Dabb family protein [Eubacteriales bacterium]
MIKHIIFTKFENPQEQAPIASEMLLSLKDKIPQIVSIETGMDVLHSARSYDMALIVTFNTLDDLKIYDHHPAHEAVRAYIKAHRTASASVDFTF